MSIAPAGRLLVALCLAGGAVASELVDRDLILRLEGLPTAFTYQVDGPSGSSSGEDSFGMMLALAAGGRYSFAPAGQRHGPLLGFEGAILSGQLKPRGGLEGVEARVMAGYACALGNRWTADLCARFGVGYSRMTLEDQQAFGSLTVTGPMLSWSTEVGLHWQASEDWRLGLSVGYRDTTYALRGSGIDLGIDSAGLTWALGIEYALSQAPSALE